MDGAKQLFVFTLEGQRYALDLTSVQRTILVVEITTLPKPHESVLGVINMQGRPPLYSS